MVRIDAKWPLAGVLSGLVLMAAGAAPAGADPGGRSAFVRMQEELGLTVDQTQAIRELHRGQRESRRQLGRALHEARQALRTLILDGADEAAIQARMAEVRELAGQLVEMRAKWLQGMAQILTPEQREKLKSARPRGHGGRMPLAG